jgi:glycosyltransferase involved in cell wall biosynthesis
MRTVVDAYPKARLIIAGDGPTRIEVERKIEELKLCNNVHLLGIKSNMQEIMCSADVFALNSTLEGMPLVLLEAMSCSLPVVTTPAGGIPELVRPGIDGIVTEGYSNEEYAEKLIDLLENNSKRKKLGAAGKARVEDKFTAERIVSKYEKVFEEAIGK